MLTIEDKTLIQDKEYVFGILHEQYNQQLKRPKYTFRFPCHDENIELTKPEDTYVQCPRCLKKYLMTFSANRSKLWSE